MENYDDKTVMKLSSNKLAIFHNHISARIYLLKVNNGNNRTMSEICLKLTVKTP